MRVVGIWIVLSALSLAQSAPSARVVCDADCDRPAFVAAMKAALTRALPICERLMAATLPNGESLVFHFHGSPETYTAAVGPTMKLDAFGARATTIAETKESHVVIDPSIDAAYLARVDNLPDAVLTTTLREMTHQLALRAGLFPEEKLPDWYVVGRAGSVAARLFVEIKKRESSVDLGMRLGFSSRTGTPEEIAADALIERGLNARENGAKECAESIVGLFDVLATTKDSNLLKGFSGFEEALRTRPRPAAERAAADEKAEISTVLKEKLGDYAVLMRALRAPGRPITAWSARLGAVDQTSSEVICTCGPAVEYALAIAPNPAKGRKYSISGEVSLPFGGDREANIEIAYDPATRAEIILSISGDGAVNLKSYRDGGWRGFGSKKMEGLPIMGETPIPFEVAINGRRVRAKVRDLNFSGELPPDLALPAKPYWGVGAHRSTARFRGLKLGAG